MESLSIDLKVISCRDLKSFNFFQKLSIYAIVSVVKVNDDDDLAKNRRGQHHHLLQWQKIPADGVGNGSPEWNHEVHFDLKGLTDCSASGLFLKFEMRCQRKINILAGKNIGEVHVPFKDLINEFKSNGPLVRYVSYQVRTSPNGKPNGVLNFSYKFTEIAKKMKENSENPIADLSLTQAIQLSTEKVCYPSVDTDSVPAWPDIFYPRLSEASLPSESCDYGSSEGACDTPWPRPPCSLPIGTYYWAGYYRPPPLLQPPTNSYYLFHNSEDGCYNQGLCGYPTNHNANTVDGGVWRSSMTG